MDGIPPVLSRDSEDVAWALQTAEALWKRGERVDAIVWLRRAAQAAGEAEDDNRAVMLARNAAELTDWIASHTMSGTPPTADSTASHHAVDDLLGDLPRPPESETFSLGIGAEVSVISADEFESGLRAPSRQPSDARASDARASDLRASDPRGTLTSDSEVMTVSIQAGEVELLEAAPGAYDDDLDTDVAQPDRARIAAFEPRDRRGADGELEVGEIELLPSEPPPRFDDERDALPSFPAFAPPPVPSAEALHAGMLDPWAEAERRSALPQPPRDAGPPRNEAADVRVKVVAVKRPGSRFDEEEVVTSAKGAPRAMAPPVPAGPPRPPPPRAAPPKGPPPMKPRLPPPPPPVRRPPPMKGLPREEPPVLETDPPRAEGAQAERAQAEGAQAEGAQDEGAQDEPVTAQFAKLTSYPPAQATGSLRAPALAPTLDAIERAVVSESPLSLADVIEDDEPQRSTMESAILAPPPRIDVTPPSARATGAPRASSSVPAPHFPPPSNRGPVAPTRFRTPPPPPPNAGILPATVPPPSRPRAAPSHSKMPTPPVPSSGEAESNREGATHAPSSGSPVTRVSSRAPSEAPAPAAQPAPRPIAQLELSSVEALGDLPDEAREEFARVARIEVLAKDEEVSNFALALVIDGEVDISSPLVDAPALRLERNAILRSRGTLDDGVQLRLVCASDSARVAIWNDAAVNAAFRTCPWVEDDLRALADVVQTKVGVTMGPLGERFDMGLREHVTSKLIVRNLAPGEEIATQGKAVHGLIVIGVGEIEILHDDTKSGVLRSGDFLFPSEVLSSGKAPATARAGKNGALILSGDRRTTNELLMSFPPLLEFLAMG